MILGVAGLAYVPTSGKEGAHLKTVWHTLDDFLYHWYNKHSKDIHYRWTTIALELGISREELASACLSVNLDSCPLPSSDVGLQIVPKSLPDRPWYGHNALVRGPPWNVTIRGDFASVFHTPKPPVGPPPAHVLNQDSSKQSSSGHRPLPSLNASGPIRPLAKPAPSSTSAASSASKPAPVIDLGEDLRPAVVHANGSRFAAVPPGSSKSHHGLGDSFVCEQLGMCWSTRRCWPLPLPIPQCVPTQMPVQCGLTAGLCHQP